jgi:predicted amidohydrolase
MNTSATLRLGIAQIRSRPEPGNNLPLLEECLCELSRQKADLVVFPEYCLSLGSFTSLSKSAQTREQYRDSLGRMCRRHGLPAVFGGVPVRENKCYFNSALFFSAAGRLLARYDKRHLFALDDGKQSSVQESYFFTPGNSPPTVFRFKGWKIALTICFDLRFPVFWQSANPHPDLYLCPAAFTHATGKDHWLPLLQARAIENLSWVAGIGQCGDNLETGLEMHGHSAVFDPWGRQTAPLFRREPACFCLELDKQVLTSSRKRLPACSFTVSVKRQEFLAAWHQ